MYHTQNDCKEFDQYTS